MRETTDRERGLLRRYKGFFVKNEFLCDVMNGEKKASNVPDGTVFVSANYLAPEDGWLLKGINSSFDEKGPQMGITEMIYIEFEDVETGEKVEY